MFLLSSKCLVDLINVARGCNGEVLLSGTMTRIQRLGKPLFTEAEQILGSLAFTIIHRSCMNPHMVRLRHPMERTLENLFTHHCVLDMRALDPYRSNLLGRALLPLLTSDRPKRPCGNSRRARPQQQPTSC